MRLFKTIAGLRSALRQRQGASIGLVPTMGALHDGHSSLIKRAVAEADVVVVSIFVNPLQFGPTEDLAAYPRQLEQDCQKCRELDVTFVFAPTPEEMAVGREITAVVPPSSLTANLCAPFRPGHFTGVATIVTKFLAIAAPALAYFGEKDAQQLAIIRRLVADLNLPVEIRSCPTVREASGLALSSRNQYLTATERAEAAGLWRSLQSAQRAFCKGERGAIPLLAAVKAELATAPGVQVQYIELVHPQTLAPLARVEEAGLLAIAAFVGETRLIDNTILVNRQPIIAIDGPAGSGKSTVTRRLAHRLGLLHLDTGAMYRAVTWLVMKQGIPLNDEASIAELMEEVKVELLPTDSWEEPTRVRINNEEVTDLIRTPEVTASVSPLSAQLAVRQALVAEQRRLGQRGGLVAEGRDIGTNVFPNAELKIYLTASVEERAKRRWQELQNRGLTDISLEKLQREIQQRDYQDSTRPLAPLRQAADAIEINTDRLTIEEVTEEIVQRYQEKLTLSGSNFHVQALEPR